MTALLHTAGAVVGSRDVIYSHVPTNEISMLSDMMCAFLRDNRGTAIYPARFCRTLRTKAIGARRPDVPHPFSRFYTPLSIRM